MINKTNRIDITTNQPMAYPQGELIMSILLSGNSKENSNRIVEMIVGNKKLLSPLMALVVSREKKIIQRAVWPLYLLAEKKPSLLLSYLPNLAKILDENSHHPAVHRNITGIFQYVDLPESLHGPLLNSCFNLLNAPLTPVATRVNCMTVLKRLAAFYPDILPELKLSIADQLPQQKASFLARAKHEKLL